MKIKDAKVFVCSPGRNFVTLKIYTDEGIYGLGDCTLNGRELAVASYLTDHVIPCIIGRDPFQTEDLRSEEHTSELQSQSNLVCRLLLEKKKKTASRSTSGRSQFLSSGHQLD